MLKSNRKKNLNSIRNVQGLYGHHCVMYHCMAIYSECEHLNNKKGPDIYPLESLFPNLALGDLPARQARGIWEGAKMWSVCGPLRIELGSTAVADHITFWPQDYCDLQ